MKMAYSTDMEASTAFALKLAATCEQDNVQSAVALSGIALFLFGVCCETLIAEGEELSESNVLALLKDFASLSQDLGVSAVKLLSDKPNIEGENP